MTNSQRVYAPSTERREANQPQAQGRHGGSFKSPSLRKRGNTLSAKARIILPVPWQSRMKFAGFIRECLEDTSMSFEERQGLENNLRLLEDAHP